MTPEWIGALARYNRWMNDKLYAVDSKLNGKPARKNGDGRRNL